MSDRMIKTTYAELRGGGVFWKHDWSDLPDKMIQYERVKPDMTTYNHETVYIKEPEMDKKQRAMERIKNAEAELAMAREMLAEEEVTYSIGDRFVTNRHGKLVMARMNNKIGLIELDTGRNWGSNWSSNVSDEHRITLKEMGHLWNSKSVTRYWDARKQCKV